MCIYACLWRAVGAVEDFMIMISRLFSEDQHFLD